MFQTQVVLQLLLDTRPNGDFVVSRDIGHSLEKKNAFNELIRVFHFVDGLMPGMVGKHAVAPVLAHFWNG